MSDRKPPDTALFVTESRLAQGFPPRVEDPIILTRVATLLVAAGQDTGNTRPAEQPRNPRSHPETGPRLDTRMKPRSGDRPVPLDQAKPGCTDRRDSLSLRIGARTGGA